MRCMESIIKWQLILTLQAAVLNVHIKMFSCKCGIHYKDCFCLMRVSTTSLHKAQLVALIVYVELNDSELVKF